MEGKERSRQGFYRLSYTPEQEAQSRAVGPELLKAAFCSKARSAAMSGVSAEGAKMVGVGRGTSQQFQQLYSCGCRAVLFFNIN